MSAIKNYERSLERSRASLHHGERPRTFALAGVEWHLLEGVFAPPFSASTGMAMELLGLAGPAPAPWRGSFLEVGSGTGVIAVSAALAGCDRVTALDISEQAVRNTAMNAARHDVADRVHAVHSDLFDALAPGDRHDTVYWHSNFVLAPPEYRYASVHERAYVDPGYRAHRRYLAECLSYVTPGGGPCCSSASAATSRRWKRWPRSVIAGCGSCAAGRCGRARRPSSTRCWRSPTPRRAGTAHRARRPRPP